MNIFNLFLATIIIPLIPVILCLNFRRVKGEITHPVALLDTALSMSLGIPGVIILALFTLAATGFGLKCVWIGFSYLIGILGVFYFEYSRVAKNKEVHFDIFKVDGKSSRNSKTMMMFFSICILVPLLASQASYIFQMLEIEWLISPYEVPVIMLLLSVTMLICVFCSLKTRMIFIRIASMIALIGIVLVPLVILYKSGGLYPILTQMELHDRDLLSISHTEIFYFYGGMLLCLVIPGQLYALTGLRKLKTRSEIAVTAIFTVCISTVLIWCSIYLGFINSPYTSDNPVSYIFRIESLHASYLTPLGQISIFALVFILAMLVMSFILDIQADRTQKHDSQGKIKELLFAGIFVLLTGLLITRHTPIDPILMWIVTGCAFAPAFFARYTSRIKIQGIIASLAISPFVVIFWNYLRLHGLRIFGNPLVHEIIAGFIFSMLVALIVSAFSGGTKSDYESNLIINPNP